MTWECKSMIRGPMSKPSHIHCDKHWCEKNSGMTQVGATTGRIENHIENRMDTGTRSRVFAGSSRRDDDS